MYSTVLVGVRERMRGEGRELPGMGALAIFICRWVCRRVRVPIGGDSPECGANLALGTSWGKYSPTQYCKTCSSIKNIMEYVCSH